MRERIVAIAGAVALVALAVVVRFAFFGDDGGGGDGDGGDRPVVACTPDLMAVCDVLVDEGRIAADPPRLDLADAADPDPAVDGWIAWDPAPALANFDAGDERWGEPVPVAHDRIDMLSNQANADTLVGDCAPDAGPWWCLARTDLAVGVGDPATSQGLARLAPLALATRNTETGEPDAGLRTVVDSPANGQAPMQEQVSTILTKRGELHVVVGSESVLAEAARTDRGKNQGLDTLVPDDASEALMTVVLAPARGGDLGNDPGDVLGDQPSDALVTALADAGAPQPGGTLMDEDTYGFLYRVRDEVG